MLGDAAHLPTGSNDDPYNPTMFQHYVAEVLQVLDERDDMDQTELAKLEWQYLPVLEYSSRPAKVLPRMLAAQPQLFIEFLCTVFRSSDDSSPDEQQPKPTEQEHAVATQAFRLLESWSHIPGTRNDGTIDGEALEDWIKQARLLARDSGREDVADSRIGTILSASPIGAALPRVRRMPAAIWNAMKLPSTGLGRRSSPTIIRIPRRHWITWRKIMNVTLNAMTKMQSAWIGNTDA